MTTIINNGCCQAAPPPAASSARITPADVDSAYDLAATAIAELDGRVAGLAQLAGVAVAAPLLAGLDELRRAVAEVAKVAGLAAEQNGRSTDRVHHLAATVAGMRDIATNPRIDLDALEFLHPDADLDALAAVTVLRRARDDHAAATARDFARVQAEMAGQRAANASLLESIDRWRRSGRIGTETARNARSRARAAATQATALAAQS